MKLSRRGLLRLVVATPIAAIVGKQAIPDPLTIAPAVPPWLNMTVRVPSHYGSSFRDTNCSEMSNATSTYMVFRYRQPEVS